MDRDLDARATDTGPKPRDFRNALRENDAGVAAREASAQDVPREETIRTYETASAPPPSAPYEPVTPRTTTEAGTVGSTYAPATTAERTTTERRIETVDDRRGPFSLVAGFLGWAVASFFTFVLLAIILGIIGASAFETGAGGTTATLNETTLNNLAWPGIIGGLVAVFVAYFVGGYNAGRIDRYNGLLQGVVVVAWTVVFAIVAALLANTVVASYDVGAYFSAYRIDWGTLTTQGVIGLVLTLLVMLAGAIAGGMVGERWLQRDVAYERRGYSTTRSRPRL